MIINQKAVQVSGLRETGICQQGAFISEETFGVMSQLSPTLFKLTLSHALNLAVTFLHSWGRTSPVIVQILSFKVYWVKLDYVLWRRGAVFSSSDPPAVQLCHS